MKNCGMSAAAQESVFRVLSGILALGNVEFQASADENREACSVVDEGVLQRVAHLLQVSSTSLTLALTTHKLYKQGDTTPAANAEGSENDTSTRKGRMTAVTQFLTKEQCDVNRDTLAKELYNRVFSWIVSAINVQVEYIPVGKIVTPVLGVLDIYGFEILEVYRQTDMTHSVHKHFILLA
jgi:myosin heavy subunit